MSCSCESTAGHHWRLQASDDFLVILARLRVNHVLFVGEYSWTSLDERCVSLQMLGDSVGAFISVSVCDIVSISRAPPGKRCFARRTLERLIPFLSLSKLIVRYYFYGANLAQDLSLLCLGCQMLPSFCAANHCVLVSLTINLSPR